MNNKKEPNKILAKVLAESIKNSKDGNGSFDLDIEDTSKIDKSEGMIIGLHTDWGGGKTTLIEDLQKELKNENDNKYFFQTINAWEFNKENKEDLWKSIISYFYLKVLEENTDEIKGEKHFKLLLDKLSLLNFVKLSSSIVGLFTGTKSNLLEKFTEELVNVNPEKQLESIKDNISIFYGMKEDVKKILNYEKIKNKYNKYILVIDDLDRCSPREVVNLLDSLKIFLDLPNIIVIVAVDRRHIEKGIYEVYNKDNGEQYLVNPDEYLEKIIHLPIDLFLFDDDIKNIGNNKGMNLDLNKSLIYTLKQRNKKNNKDILLLIDEELIKILNKKDIKNIINFGLSNNPRKISRFKRLFKFYYNIFYDLGFFSNKNSDINEKFLIFWLILKLEWGDYFKEIIKKPILLNYIDNNDIDKIINYYSNIFYEKSYNLLSNFKKNKLENYIKFLKFNIDIDKISIYFLSFQIGKDYINEGEKSEKNLFSPLVDLIIFKNNFLDNYKNTLSKIYIDGMPEVDDINLTNFEKDIIKEYFKNITVNKKTSKDNIKNISNKKNDISDKAINKELIGKEGKTDFPLKTYIKENNINLSECGLKGDGEMITGLMEYDKAKDNDEKRYLLGSKIFFDKILDNFEGFYYVEILNGENKEKKFRDLISLEKEFYQNLGNEHILNDLENGVKRTMFGEIINQMSFAKFGPSLGGMVGATDFIQLENIVISNIENASDKNKYNVEEWRKVIKGAIILDEDISLENQTEKYIEMIKFVEEINDEIKIKIKRLKKRLLYVFSHFWALQDIEKFPVYYGKSREGLASLGIWSYKYGDLNKAIENYNEFSEKYGKLVEQLKNEKLVEKLDVNNFKNTLNEKFKDYLGEENSTYINNYYYYKIIQDFLYFVSDKK